MPHLSHPLPGLGLFGTGAFGRFCIPHLRPHFTLHPHDPAHPQSVPLAVAAAQPIVLLAVPLSRLRELAIAIAPHLQPGALVLDVCSIKLRPLAILEECLPGDVDIVGTHPLFGPQSGKDGIAGLRIAVCEARGRRAAGVARFLRDTLRLTVLQTTPAEHDRQVAYVQGLTHLLARIVIGMDIPPLQQETVTFSHLMRMVDTVRHDSDELFRTITAENPFMAEVRDRFAASARRTLEGLATPHPIETEPSRPAAP